MRFPHLRVNLIQTWCSHPTFWFYNCQSHSPFGALIPLYCFRTPLVPLPWQVQMSWMPPNWSWAWPIMTLFTPPFPGMQKKSFQMWVDLTDMGLYQSLSLSSLLVWVFQVCPVVLGTIWSSSPRCGEHFTTRFTFYIFWFNFDSIYGLILDNLITMSIINLRCSGNKFNVMLEHGICFHQPMPSTDFQ